jgi:chromosome segregation ATPase|uniref:Cilia- and flagella-associated protein 263 n=1 Tax=Eutreptiella gymnastica TaxID=73025 RepID=A0A7S4LA27_9EUGL|mmetsp:Transcript_18515/g.32112  ORF Transcript_18515/g.32112 Transcript_18515/m.32112 type:complete len:412 (-) Transcript_18515:83-1318(-)|eukprot:CAMPEP_0174304378 /NCGR_PEP_ID=MMETSP0809-20121228/60750_1 /TAXON_ID=73025 ORGANISM="Eutreptiella gymnastica-like, Strain CCMP1594" /NCGR_SAMPLE_ID=MMETSP0809 /ASSEMBLY_ACC=CAM_ASM_000658 /LENGTH=411 /DNA_ID=CAMNT_0015410601 /DNA_START=120 /DNA_END=1355 /DNA_ORIENTATION=-
MKSATINVGNKDKLYKRYPEPDNIDEKVKIADDDARMATSALEELLDAIQADTNLLEEENKIFNSYLKNVANQQHSQLRVAGGDPTGPSSDEQDMVSEISDGSVGTSNTASTAMTGKKSKGRSRRRSSSQKDVLLEIERKVEIATAEMDRLKQEKEEEVKVMEKNQETVRACMEEAELRIQETRRDMYEFRRDIVGDKKLDAEKIIRYLDERLKLKDTHVSKLKLKSQALKAQIAKYEHQLKQREDMGEVLHAIDFDQLKIENQQFLERIEQKNKELVKLKLTTGNTVQTMNALTEKLNKFSTEQTWLKKEIKQREEHLQKLMEDISLVQQEKEAAEKKNTQLRLQHEAVKVPKVEDYIQQKAEMYELEKAAANWKRKVEIAEGQKKIVLQQKHTMRQSAKQPAKQSFLPA